MIFRYKEMLGYALVISLLLFALAASILECSVNGVKRLTTRLWRTEGL